MVERHMLQIHYHLPTLPTVMQLYIHSIKLVVTRGLTVDTHAMAVKMVSPQLGKSAGRAWRRRRWAGCLWDRCLVQAAPRPARGSARGASDEETVMMIVNRSQNSDPLFRLTYRKPKPTLHVLPAIGSGIDLGHVLGIRLPLIRHRVGRCKARRWCIIQDGLVGRNSDLSCRNVKS